VTEFTTGVTTCETPSSSKNKTLIAAINGLSAIRWTVAMDVVGYTKKYNTLPENLSDFSRVHIYGY